MGDYSTLTNTLRELNALAGSDDSTRDQFWSVAIEEYISKHPHKKCDSLQRRLATLRLLDRLEKDALLPSHYIEREHVRVMNESSSTDSTVRRRNGLSHDLVVQPPSTNGRPPVVRWREKAPAHSSNGRFSGIHCTWVSLLLAIFFSVINMALFNMPSVVIEDVSAAPRLQYTNPARKKASRLAHPTATAQEESPQTARIATNAEGFKLPPSTKYCLIHVGKTAGKTVACEVGIKSRVYHCSSKTPEPSRLRDAYVATVHLWDGASNLCERHIGSINAFLFILRNPIDRIISWYYYEHPLAPFWQKQPLRPLSQRKAFETSKQFHKGENNTQGCFSNLEDFALNAIPPNPSNGNFSQETWEESRSSDKTKCQRLAWDVATGKRRCFYHNAFGYSYYFERTKQLHLLNPHEHKIILAIRTEHLAQDWDILDAAFDVPSGAGIASKVNGTMRFHTGFRDPETIKSKLKNHNARLSPQARRNLCQALCAEIQMFKHILHLAINLSADQKETSLKLVVDSCAGEETMEIRECPHPTYRSCPPKGGHSAPFQDAVECELSLPF